MIIFALSCGTPPRSLPAKQISAIQDSVRILADSIAKNVSRDGSVAWLHYFENSTDFFMVSDGQLVFPDIDSARNFVNNTLVKTYRNIELHLSNVRIVPVSKDYAILAGNFHEDITYSDGKKLPTEGYLTATAHLTSEGWKLQNAHWSSIATH